MKNHTTLTDLFTALNGTLPYEYDKLYAAYGDTYPGILISKKDSETTICIVPDTPHDNGIVDTVTYDNDTETETLQWNTNSPDFNLLTLISHIEKTL